MKRYSKSFTIKILSLTSGKTYYCNSMKMATQKIGISFEILHAIRQGKRSSFATNSKGITYQINFIADKAVAFYPAWDSLYDEEKIGEKVCSSHREAILFLSNGSDSKKSTYYRLLKEHLDSGGKLGEPCSKTIKDYFGREWVVTFFKEKGEFIPNKKKSPAHVI